MVIHDKVKYVRATHSVHNKAELIEFRNFLERNHIRYFMSDISDPCHSFGEVFMFDMYIKPEVAASISEFVDAYGKKLLEMSNFIGEKSGVVWWYHQSHYEFTSPLGTKVSINNPKDMKDIENAYHDFDVDEYAISKFGLKDYPLDLRELLDDGKIIKAAYIDLLKSFDGGN